MVRNARGFSFGLLGRRCGRLGTGFVAGSSTWLFRALLKDSGRTENSLWRWLIEFRLF